MWKTDALSEAKHYKGPYPTCAAISRDEKSLAIGGRLGKVEIVSITDGVVRHALDFADDPDPFHDVDVWDVEFSPAGDFLAIAGMESWQTIIRPILQQKLVLVRVGEGWEQTELVTGQLGTATSLCFSPDGKQLVSADDTGHIKIWAIDSP